MKSKRQTRKSFPSAPGKAAGGRSAEAWRKASASAVSHQVRAAKDGRPFPIVGIGASAGGLEAVTQLLEELPGDTGMAFVLVQHLDPTHESALTSLLSRSTDMPVAEAKHNAPLEPNRLYVIPPNKVIGLGGRRLKLFPRKEGREEHMTIDHFLRSLAEEEGSSAVGIVLSGNGTDGTMGLLAVKSAGGITFAQSEKTAKYPGMPASAAHAGCVDFVLAPDKMALELQRIAGQLSRGELPEAGAGAEHPAEGKAFEEILGLLRQRTAVDFTYYKPATLRRRLQRRMVLHKVESLKEYGGFLRAHPAEVKELFNDILIHVTGFFRDPAVYQVLRRKFFPRLLKGKPSDEPLRIWVPGCSTGEEVYSMAMVLTEVMAGKKSNRPVQIFGTDINEASLEKARVGLYPEGAKADISAERLHRFFSKSDGGYRVNKTIREMCIFARQNLVNDPPFSNLDLISCRNVLIYLGPTLQRKVMPVFHYALRPTGMLMLGASESIGGFADLFHLVEKRAKIYGKKMTHLRPAVSFGHRLQVQAVPGGDGQDQPPEPVFPGIPEVQKQADRIVLTGYSPAGVVINKQMEVLQFRGRTGLYLEHAHGEATLHVLKMAREGLALDLRATVAKAMKQNVRVRQEGVRVRQNGHFLECSIEVIPFNVPPMPERFYLVLFEPRATVPGMGGMKPAKPSRRQPTEKAEMARLQDELAATRGSLQTIIEEQEATNEELRSANEEIMSSNEELQSTNEELETAKEELQSTNEELTTLNDELESRNSELEQLNNDLHNLLASVNMPILILGADLRIRRFTATAEKMFKLIPADVGRAITDINLPLELANLDKLVLEVFETLVPKDVEVRDKQGYWWSVRIRAYKTTDNKINGAVLALVDIDALKTSVERITLAHNLAEAVVNTVREPLLVLDKDLVVMSANEMFYRMFKVRAEETVGRTIYKLGHGQWNIPGLRILLEDILPNSTHFHDYAVEHEFPGIGKKKMLLNARRLAVKGEQYQTILLAIKDVTGRG